MQRLLDFVAGTFAGVAVLSFALPSVAQEQLPWKNQPESEYEYSRDADTRGPRRVPDAYSPGRNYEPRSPREEPYSPSYGTRDDAARYGNPPGRPYRQPEQRYGEPRHDDSERHARSEYGEPGDGAEYAERRGTYSQSEIIDAGHKFFGSLSKGLAQAIEYAFRRQGRPTGYILGEDAGGAFIAGLRYGEGRLYTKYGRARRVFWQGPSVGYDFGGEGTRTMVLVYGLSRPGQLFRRFGGVQGSAYVVGGASVQLLRNNNITLAPIRTGLGLRLGANIGYLKYTRRPTWNPF